MKKNVTVVMFAVCLSACVFDPTGGKPPTSSSTGGAGGGTSVGGSGGQGGASSNSASSSSTGEPVCGDGVKNGDEVCDGSDFGGLTCATYITKDWEGDLTCAQSACDLIDSSGCTLSHCKNGAGDTPTAVTAQGATATSAYLHTYVDTDQYSSNTPATLNLNNISFPGQLVITGTNGFALTFSYSGGTPAGEDLFEVNTSAVAECAGAAVTTKACETKVARDFRCLNFPAEAVEWMDDCDGSGPAVTTTFTPLGKMTSYSPPPMAGNRKVLASIRCKVVE